LKTRFADSASAIFTTTVCLGIDAIEGALSLQDHISRVVDQRNFMFALECLRASVGLIIAGPNA
jgi:hypothetical protein